MEKYGETMIHWMGLCWFNVFFVERKARIFNGKNHVVRLRFSLKPIQTMIRKYMDGINYAI